MCGVIRLPSLSHSSMQNLQACPKKYYFQKIERVQRKGETRGRRRGKAFSDALEAGGDPHVIVDAYQKLMMDAVDQQRVDDLICEEAILCELVQSHAARFTDDEREIEFRLPIDETGYDNHGFIDGVSFTSDGHVLKEDKLLQMWSRSQEAALPMNGQVLRYLGAAPLIWPDAVIKGLEYRVTKWPGTYRRKTESAREFAARVASVLREERASGKLEDRFSVHFVGFDVVKDQISRYYDDLAVRVREVEARTASGEWPHAFGSACEAYGGCEFLPACLREPGYQELYEVKGENK